MSTPTPLSGPCASGCVAKTRDIPLPGSWDRQRSTGAGLGGQAKRRFEEAVLTDYIPFGCSLHLPLS